MSTCIEYRLTEPVRAAAALSEENREAKRRNVLVYRNDVGERSETFILAQARAMQRFQPVLCGLTQRANGILPGDIQTAILTGSGRMSPLLRKRVFMHMGWARQWQRQCRAFHPVLLHAHFALDAAFALPLCRALGIPLIVSLHGYDVTSCDASFRATAGGRLFLGRRSDLFAHASLFVCVSEFVRNKALAGGYPERKLWVHPTGIDLDLFSPAGGMQREEMVLFVGRLVEKKGCAHLIRAMERVQQHRPNTQLVVIGDGPLRPHLQKLAANLLPGGHVFLGMQPFHVVRAWMRRAMIFSVPSITAADGNAEGLGMVFCEAQAMGLPVVSSASGGISEAVLDGVTGYLVPERDERELAAKLLALLNDRALWVQLSRQGRRRMLEHFDLNIQTQMLEEKYDEVLGAQASGRLGVKPGPLGSWQRLLSS